MLAEVHQAVLMARAVGGPEAMTVRGSLSLATMGGARVVGRADEIGSLEVGKLADLALWRVDGQPQAGVFDPVAGLVLGPRPPLALLLVNGQVVVEADELRTIDEEAAVRAATRAAAALS
jgi:cytosine/adenosine deaminase-related metal-dependent hydrolase